MNITNGVVEFERVARPADFESKRAKVSLSFAIADGEDAASVSARVGDMAAVEVYRLLARPEKVEPVKPPVTKPPPAATEVKTPTVPDPIADAPTVVSTVEEAAPPAVTDAHLDAAVRKARERTVTPDQIKAAILGYTKQPGVSMKSLDPPARAALVAALDALKPLQAAA